MKKTLLLALAGVAMLTSFISCGSTNNLTYDESVAPVVIDHPNKKYGDPVPEWVRSIDNGLISPESLEKYMPELKDYKVFAVVSRAKSREMAEKWAKEVDIKAEAAGIMSNNISSAVKAKLGASENGDESAVDREVGQIVRNISTVTLRGLEPKAQYWMKMQDRTETTQKNVGEPYFEYYVVAGIPVDTFSSQLNESLKEIENITTEDQNLKDVIVESISEQFANYEN